MNSLPNAPWYVIVLLSMVLMPLAGAPLFWDIFFPSERIVEIPTVDVKIIDLVGIEDSGFFATTLWVETDGGKIVPWGGDMIDPWPALDEEFEGPAAITSEECSAETVELASDQFEGILIECQTLQPTGEFCPASFYSYMLNSNGRLWQVIEPVRCTFLIMPLLIFFLFIGVAVGVAIVITRRVYRAIVHPPDEDEPDDFGTEIEQAVDS